MTRELYAPVILYPWKESLVLTGQRGNHKLKLKSSSHRQNFEILNR